MNNIYHATPYDISATGFYFSDYDEYQQKAATHKNEHGDPVEEYEIQFIDGNNCSLFHSLDVSQATLEQWFDEFEGIEEAEAVKLIYLSKELGYPMANITPSCIDDVTLFEGTILEYSEEYITSTGMLDGLPESLRYYFDYKAFARDLECEGTVSTVEIDGVNYVIG